MMLVECTQCHRSAIVCDCPANPAGTADRITELERQLAEAQKELSAEREKVWEAREGIGTHKYTYYDSSAAHSTVMGPMSHCIGCGSMKTFGCKPDCWLSALIAKLEV
jgi:hypothetical protein